MTPTCLQCLNLKKKITSGAFTGIDGRRVSYGMVDCKSRGVTRIVSLRDCREPMAALDKEAEE